jgi:hypothetical protein
MHRRRRDKGRSGGPRNKKAAMDGLATPIAAFPDSVLSSDPESALEVPTQAKVR